MVRSLILFLTWWASLCEVNLLASDRKGYDYFNLFNSQPQFRSDGGHLYIVGALGHDVIILTQGTGKVKINDEDILQVSKMARTAAETVQNFESATWKEMESSFRTMKKAINDPGGILNRIQLLEGSNKSTETQESFAVLKRKVRRLQRRMSRLDSKIRNLEVLMVTDDCQSDPCQNGGTCADVYNGFICHCPDGWEGKTCGADVDECRRFAGTSLGCENGATCLNTAGSYKCQCPEGWYGLHCTQKTFQCSKASSAELCGHGTCVAQPGTATGFTCICDPGWTTDRSSVSCTVDRNECNELQIPCSRDPPVACVNTPGSFHCSSCPPGYAGNGYHCVDIDECLIGNGGCSTNPRVQCINTKGSRVCGSCPPGYQGDGTICTYAGGLCMVNNGGCHPRATCAQNIGLNYVQCTCPAGWVGNGIGENGCQPAQISGTACQTNPCKNGATCVSSSMTSFTCQCAPGFSGQTCSDSVCSPNPCLNGGACRVTQTSHSVSYFCLCPGSYTGVNCEIGAESPTELPVGCGGRISGLSGLLLWPSNVSTDIRPGGVECEWTIVSSNNSLALNLTFVEYQIKNPQASCMSNYFDIYDGSTGKEHFHKIGRYCDTSKPPSIVTSQSSVRIMYVSGSKNANFRLSWTAVQPSCGGIYSVNAHNSISYPTYGTTSLNKDCYWKLQAPLGKRIQIVFFTMVFPAHPECDDGFLEVMDGASPDSPLLVKYCNQTNPPPLITSSRAATVHSFTKDITKQLRFRIVYSPVAGIPGCGGVVTGPSGEITAPGGERSYKPDMNCEWKIQLPLNEKIKLKFDKFNIESSEDCRYDYVKVYDGPTVESGLVGTWCGDNVPATFVSSTNTLTIVFKTDSTYNDGQIKMRFITVCGGTFSDVAGIIHSPYYPSHYSENRVCEYTIAQPLGRAITLNFLDFDLESNVNTEECNFDYIKIYDGHNDEAPLLGSYCGVRYPKLTTSTYNYLHIVFRTDNSINGRGFQANYSSFEIGCGGILKDESGTISSPKYPQQYPAFKDCTWYIHGKEGHLIQLNWLAFNVEQSSECRHDWVQMYSTAVSQENRMGERYCGDTLPPSLTSLSNIVIIVFHSDGSASEPGFRLNYNTSPKAQNCGGNFYSTMGSITSPNYPNNYPNFITCTWVINVPHGQQIQLNVEAFKLEQQMQCASDFLEIRNGGYPTSPLIKRYCNDAIDKEIISLTNQLYLKFVTDPSITDSGFRITWSGASRGCGGTLTSATGSIISPNYPQTYGRNGECYWRISVSMGSVIRLTVADLDLEYHSLCLLDYIEIFDGTDKRAPSLGRFCSMDNIAPITSKTNHIFIRFRSDMSKEGRGFHLRYITVCNRTMTGFSGVIESPNFPETESSISECLWRIIAPTGNKINLTFSHFTVSEPPIVYTFYPQRKNCSHAFLEINEGEGSAAPSGQLGKFCGDQIPSSIQSSLNNVYIHLKGSQFISSRNIFRLEWMITGCGGVFDNKLNGRFNSPGYPALYNHSLSCEWYISVPNGKSIEITVHDIHMETTGECYADALSIYGGPDDSAPLLSKMCSSISEPTVYTTSGNYAFVRFETDETQNGRGFTASFNAVDGECGGSYVGEIGNVHSHNYPQNYDPHDDCVYRIRAVKNHRVVLTFKEFDIAPTLPNCTQGFVKVYDGNSFDSPVLMTLCGNQIPEPVKSTNNEILIRHKADGFNTAKGFTASFRPMCGAIITTNGSGTIEHHEGQLLSLEEHENCSWLIRASDLKAKISLTFVTLNIGSDEEESNTIEIYAGEDTSSPLVATIVGHIAPPALTVQSSVALVVYKISYSTNIFGHMILDYSVFDSVCGGNLASEHGSFISPNYPDSYPINAECVWTLKISPGNMISLVFTVFDLPPSDACNEDYVEIREQDSDGKLLGVYCGNSAPTNVSAMSHIWVKFRSSSDPQSVKGFKAYFSLVRDIELTGTKGSIASPLYPIRYKGENEYNWRISVALRKVIKITVKDAIGEFYDDDFDCTNGVVVYDGYDSSAPRLLSACTVKIPEPKTSTSNVLYVTFKSWGGIFGDSFLLDWEEVSKSTSETTVKKEESCMTRVTLSGERGQNNSYDFTSPGFPNGYDHNLRCVWIFETVPENHLVIDFKTVDIETSWQCHADYIKIFSPGSKTEWEEKYSICSSNSTADTMKVGNVAKILFGTDFYDNRTGFSGVVRSVCGGSVSRPSGILTNKGWGLATCKWDVTVRLGHTIKVNFTKFNLRKTPGEVTCKKNYVAIRNGGSESSPFLGAGKYCGTTPPIVPESTSNKLYIEVVVDSMQQDMEMTYTEVSVECGEDITLAKKSSIAVINTPNYPNIPPPHIECSWRIMAPPGESLHFDITDRFDMYMNRGCTKEYIELRDGATELSPLIGRFCSLPPYQVTKGNALYVKYFTDINDPRDGFRAKISVSKCGGTIYDSTMGKIESPGYPDSYDSNITCEWRLVATERFRYVLTFNTFNLGSQTVYCNDSVDTLTIMDIEPGQEYLKESEPNVFCGRNNSGITFQSSGNILLIIFKSAMQPKFSQRRSFSIEYRAERTGCGGRINLPSAEIMSPGYPGYSRGSSYCVWRITVPNGRRVTFTVKDFDLEFNPSNVSSWGTHRVDFYNSFHFSNPIATWHGQKSKGSTIESSGNKMMIFYSLRYTNSHRGFSGTYTSDKPADCGGYLSGIGGTIRVPNEANNSSFYCEWEHKGTSLNMSTFSLQIVGTVGSLTETECAAAWFPDSRVTVLIGSVDMEFCSKATPASPFWVISPHQGALIEAYGTMKDKDSTPVNFTMTWKVNQCGGAMKMSSGDITSPNFPRPYLNDIDCVWLIEFPQGSAINVHFESFNLENNCDNDYLIVRNGKKLSSPEIGKFCGSIVPADIITQSNYVWVSFHSNEAKAESGFKINLTPVTQGCGGIYHDQKGRLQTPNYPSSYENNIECDWEIRVEPGLHIGLTLMGRFYVEDSPGCVNDFLEVSDFLGGKWKSIGRVCGRSPQLVFNTTSNRMRVFFRSNDKVRADGFMAMWSSNCGGLIEAKGPGKIYSPGYPKSYEGPLNCNYTVLSQGSIISVKFNAFQLERGGPFGCTNDRLIVFLTKDTGRYEPLGTFCGSFVPNSFTSRNKFGLHFIAPPWASNTGFEVSYDMEVCGGTITTETMISPPTVNGRYFPNMECVWNITAPKNHVIVIKFSKLHISIAMQCNRDYILIYDMASNSSQLLGRICGNFGDKPPVFRTSGNLAKLMFVTDHFHNTEGFSAKVSFRRGCGGLINIAGTTALSSPDFDGNGKYDPMLDCHWSLRAPPQQTIVVTFKSFNVSTCRNVTASRLCTCDYVEIFDGPSENDELIGRFCGDNRPQTVSSSDRYLSLTFITDGTEEGKGFEIEAYSVVSQCGPSILNATDEPQELTSPGYPNNYPDNSHCLWLIANTFTDLDIHFKYLNLEPSAMCSADRLELTTFRPTPFIPEGFGGDQKVFIGKSTRNLYVTSLNVGSRMPTTKSMFCGEGQPLDFYSSFRQVQIRFISDSKTTAKGFQLTYSIATCNRNYTAAQGRVLKSRLERDCLVSISAPEPNATISLYFLDISIVHKPDCSYAKLQVYDGPTEASPLLSTNCGYRTPSPIFSTGPNLLVKYTTTGSMFRGSFDFTYTTTTKGRGCGGSIFNYGGSFSSPNYPGNYRNNSNCRWDILVPTGNVPVIEFTEFDLGTSTCDQDYLELYDVDTTNNIETLRTKYCGMEKPARFTGKTGVVAVKYKTSVHNSGVGWYARFMSVLASDTSD